MYKAQDEDESDVLVLCGPIVGQVTATTANILLEVDEDAMIVCRAVPEDGSGELAKSSRKLKKVQPGVFQLRSLNPNTRYSIEFGGLASVQQDKLKELGCCLRTMPSYRDLKQLRFVALSCNFPTRLERGAENPWGRVNELTKDGKCDVVLHLGDQVYTWENGRMVAASRAIELLDGKEVSSSLRHKMMRTASKCLQDSYRNVWAQGDTAAVLAHTSNLMIWSDNDVTNDFTTARKEDGSQQYPPEYLSVAMGVYRMYQRQLWDPDCDISVELSSADLDPDEAASDPCQEWHFHTYGPCGVFFIDMRGNRIRRDGTLQEGLPPILSETQRESIKQAFETTNLSCMLLCAEIPFVGAEPETIRKEVEDSPQKAFLKDHWPYELPELLWILDLCFSWKVAAEGREVILLGGDIHVGVDSVIADSETGQQIRHITTSPITNRVSKFFYPTSGRLNERYTFEHRVLEQARNFVVIDLSFEDGRTEARVELVGVPPTSEGSKP